jgi:hypothetical protein
MLPLLQQRFFVDMVDERMDVLGRHIQNGGISVAKSKIDTFVALRSPTPFQELGRNLITFTWLTDRLVDRPPLFHSETVCAALHVVTLWTLGMDRNT